MKGWIFSISIILLNFCYAHFSTDVHPSLSLCPLLQSLDSNLTFGRFAYPSDVYAKNITSKCTSKSPSECYYNCTAYELFNFEEPHICNLQSVDKVCPLLPHNIKESMTYGVRDVVSTQNDHDLCILNRHIHNPNAHIRVIIFGGSVTNGQEAMGCCIRPECYVRSTIACSWGAYFSDWLKTTSNATVTHYNLAERGFSSEHISEFAVQNLRNLGISNLSSTDFILLDHSVNDHLTNYYYSSIETDKLKTGLESMIRSFYKFSIPNERPIIVLLSAGPLTQNREIQTEDKSYYDPNLFYHNIYYNLTRYYNLTMWSMRNTILSTETREKQRDFVDYLTWKNNQYVRGKLDPHPPWHVHLFTADLYASIFQIERQLCDKYALNNSSNNNSHIEQLQQSQQSQQHQKHNNTRTHIHNTHNLPKRLYHMNYTASCDTDHPPLMHFSYSDYIKNKPMIGTFLSVPNTTWLIREDSKGRGGIIRELYTPFVNDHNQGDFGYMTIRPGVNIESVHGKQVILTVEYLRTYFNGGLAEIRFCNKLVGTIDGLWSDYEHYKFSIPQTFVADLTISRDCNEDTLEIIHRISKCNMRRQPSCQEPVIIARDKQKIKIISVNLCLVKQ